MKKKTIHKLLSAMLTLSMAAALTACGGAETASGSNESQAAAGSVTQTDAESQNETAGGNPVSDTPVTFTMMYSGEYNPDYKSLAKMTELTNVTLDVTAIPDSDYDTRNQLIINTGEDMPDLISKTKPTTAQALSGVLLPVSDYFDQMPNYMKFIKDNNLQYLIDNATQTDGKVYELPVNTK